MSNQSVWENLKGDSQAIIERLKTLIHEGNVRRVVVQHEGRTIAEFPVTAGVIGALLFTIWPFFGKGSQMGTLAWVGGAVALAVYFLTLRRSSGGVAYDFLQRLVRRQRGE